MTERWLVNNFNIKLYEGFFFILTTATTKTTNTLFAYQMKHRVLKNRDVLHNAKDCTAAAKQTPVVRENNKNVAYETFIEQ